MKTNVMQIVRLVMMIVAVAGIIYALEYMERGIAVWFWITLLGVGFVGLLYTFRLTQRRVRLERRARERQEKKKSHAFVKIEKRKDYEKDCYSTKRHAFHGSMRKRKRRSKRS